MAGGKIEVQIGADITDLQSKIDQAEKELGKLRVLKNKEIRLGLDTSDTLSKISALQTKLASLNKTASTTASATKSIGDSAKAAIPEISNIGSEITKIGGAGQLASEGMSELTGSIGAAGLTGILGVVSGALKLAYDQFEKNRIAAGAMAKAISDANAEAVKNSGEEIATIRALVNVAKDLNKTDAERLTAVRYLKQEWPGTYANLTNEEILLGRVDAATKSLTDSLLKKAKAQVFASKIGENEAHIEILKAEGRALLNNNDLITKAAKILGYVSPSLKAISDEIDILIGQNKVLRKELEKNVTFGFVQDKPKIVKPKKDKTHAKFDTTFISPFVSTISGLGDFMGEFDDRVALAFENATATIKKETDAMTLLLKEFDKAANDIILNSITETFSQLGGAIGIALATGGDVLGAIGTTLLQGLANFLSSMGDLLIQYGTLAIVKGKLDLAIAAGGPVSIGAGIAAIAVGIALKAASSAIGSFATGGGGGRASSNSGSGANNSNFTSSGYASNNNGGTVVFEIAGQKLIGVLSNTINANRRLGGQLGLG